MPTPSIIQTDPEFRAILVRLGDAILPIGAWIVGRPAPWPRAPWRAPGAVPLSVESLGALDVIDALIQGGDDSLDQRWIEADTKPFARLPDPVEARSRWQLADRAQDGVPLGPDGAPVTDPRFRADAKSWPTLVDKEHLTLDRKALPAKAERRAFYEACLVPLKNAVAKLRPEIDWKALAQALLRDEDKTWPPSPSPSPVPTSSRFIRTFARDLLIGMMGQKNGEVGAYAEGLLVELNEGRRTGNRFSAADVEAAREAFDAVLRSRIR